MNVRMSTSTRFVIPNPENNDLITASSTILHVKNIIAKQEACGNCPVERQRLIFKGVILSDNTRTLADYGLSIDNQTIHLVKGRAEPAAPSTTTPTSIPATEPLTNTTTSISNVAFNPFMMMQQQQSNGAMPGLPNMNEMQQQLMQNPEMMSNIMQSPMMQNLMSNPDTIRMMMENNPEMRRVMDSNPQLRAVLDDPEMMRRSLEMMRDPSSMQNMMRNQELAMSQIENLPGGFNALRRMYEDVQEPMMDAMSGMGSSSSGGTASSSSASSPGESTNAGAGAGGTAMPNPWGSSPRTSAPAASSNTSSNPSLNSGTNPWAGNGTGASTSPWLNPSASGNTTGTPGMPGMPNMNLEQTISMLENPLINNMMQQMMSDPASLQQMMDSNPMMQQMRQSNPAAAAMMSNPEMMRSMMDPSNLRAMLQAQQAMQTLGNNGFPMMPPFIGGQAPNTSTSNNNSNSGLDFSSLLNQFQTTSVSSPVPSSPVTPEQRFENQLKTLNDMGFTDREANIRALEACHGNVNRAVERLISEN